MSFNECNTIEQLLIEAEPWFPNLYEYIQDPTRLTKDEIKELNSVFEGPIRDKFLSRLIEIGSSEARTERDTALLYNIAISFNRLNPGEDNNDTN